MSDESDKAPEPNRLDAERCLLGDIILWGEMRDGIKETLCAKDFSEDAHRTLFTHFTEMNDAGEPIKFSTLIKRLQTAGHYDQIGGSAYLRELVQSVPEALHIKYHLRVMKKGEDESK